MPHVYAIRYSNMPAADDGPCSQTGINSSQKHRPRIFHRRVAGWRATENALSGSRGAVPRGPAAWAPSNKYQIGSLAAAGIIFSPSKLTCGDRTICCRRVACAGTRRRTGACNRMRGTSGGPGVRFGRRLPRGDGAVRPKATTRHGVWAAGVGRGIARGCRFWIAPTGRANQLTGRAGSST